MAENEKALSVVKRELAAARAIAAASGGTGRAAQVEPRSDKHCFNA